MTTPFGPVEIVDLGTTYSIEEGQTSKRRRSSGVGYPFVVTGLPNLETRVAYVDWENGDREVRGLPGSRPSNVLSRLAKGSRISISPYEDDLEWMELRISSITTRGQKVVWSNPKSTCIDDLSKACGFNVEAALLDLGSTDIGTREELVRTMNNRRRNLCVLFPRGDRIIPVAAFAAARVIPLCRQA